MNECTDVESKTLFQNQLASMEKNKEEIVVELGSVEATYAQKKADFEETKEALKESRALYSQEVR